MNSSETKPRPLMTVNEAADYLRLGVSTLNKMRVSGGGPAYIKLGSRRVAYDLVDLVEWRTKRRRFSTNQI